MGIGVEEVGEANDGAEPGAGRAGGGEAVGGAVGETDHSRAAVDRENLDAGLCGGREAADVDLTGAGVLEEVGGDLGSDDGDLFGSCGRESFSFRGSNGEAAHFGDPGGLIHSDDGR